MYNSLVKNKRLILILPILLAAGFFVPSVPPAHAAGFTGTGLVCITASTTATNCSNAAPTLGPFAAGATFSVGVFINNSRAMGGFDIEVAADPAVLHPTSAALGSLIVNPSLTSICINGSPTVGSCTIGTANANGVVEVTTIEATAVNECGGISPCSGLAFTVTYTVVSVPSTGSTLLTYPTAAGCSVSSVASPPNTCVEVADATGTVLPETDQGATVTIGAPTAQVCIYFPPLPATTCSPGAVTVGPYAIGQMFTVGVRVQNSPPYAGYKIYVRVDPKFLSPKFGSVKLGPGIANPAPPDICVNNQAQNGTCTPLEANANGVVEVATFDTSGLNECTAAPCSGQLFNITYTVVHNTPSTTIHIGPPGLGCALGTSVGGNICVEVLNSFGTVLSESPSDVIVTGTAPFNNPTRGVVSCAPTKTVPGNATTCEVVINDIAMTGRSDPTGDVSLTTTSLGTFIPPQQSCSLDRFNSSAANCFFTYTPTVAGLHIIGCIYPGDAAHLGANCPGFTVNSVKASVSLVTAVIVDRTGLPAPSTGVPLGLSVHDTAFLGGGFPVTGVTGTVTYTLFTNLVCTGTSVFTSTVTVAPGTSNNVPRSASVFPAALGNYSFIASYSGDSANLAATSACEPFTVVSITPTFTAGKLHWTHHLSLSKSGNMQSWTAIVTNPLTVNTLVVIRIIGASAINPALTFDVTCGVTCVNTNGNVNTAAVTAGPQTVGAGAKSSFSFSQLLPTTFANNKFAFTATVYWSAGAPYAASDSKSGSFAVVS